MGLTRITGKQATSAAIRKIRSVFRERGTQYRRAVGYRGGQVPSAYLYAVEAAGIWFTYDRFPKRHWCAFGTLPLPDAGSVPITVEINPPFANLDRRVAGLLAADDAGTLYLCHTGRIGGGTEGIGQERFLAWFDRKRVLVIDPDGRSTLAFPIAEVGSARMVEQIAEYVWAVADFKAGRPARAKTAPKGPFGGSDDEFEGSKHVSARGAYTASCDHGIIRHRLDDLISETGQTVSRDQQRDLLVGKPSAPEIEFEIKTTADSQSVYTAVGQLLMHNAMNPVKRRVAVLPDSVDKKTRRALAFLEIDLVTYRWTKAQIRFTGLDKIIPGTGNAAPISTRKQ